MMTEPNASHTTCKQSLYIKLPHQRWTLFEIMLQFVETRGHPNYIEVNEKATFSYWLPSFKMIIWQEERAICTSSVERDVDGTEAHLCGRQFCCASCAPHKKAVPGPALRLSPSECSFTFQLSSSGRTSTILQPRTFSRFAIEENNFRMSPTFRENHLPAMVKILYHCDYSHTRVAGPG
jgi:hypothetical protein